MTASDLTIHVDNLNQKYRVRIESNDRLTVEEHCVPTLYAVAEIISNYIRDKEKYKV